MANTFLTSDILAREAVLLLENNLVMGNLANRSWEGEFQSARQGDSIRIRKPASMTVTEFTNNGSNTTTPQAVTETSTTLTLEKLFDVSFQVTSKEMTLSIDDFNERLMRPAMAAMAQKIDSYILGKFTEVGGLAEVNDVFAAPSTIQNVAKIVEKLNNQKAPMSRRAMVVSPRTQTALYGVSEFSKVNERGPEGVGAIREASMGRFLGMDFYMDQNVQKHTAGSMAADATQDALAIDNGAGYSKGDTTIHVDGATTATSAIAVGDVIRITYDSGNEFEHTVTTAVTFSSSEGDVVISPPLYEDVSDNAVVAFVQDGAGTSEQNIAFTPEALALVMVNLAEPLGPGTDSTTMSYRGFSLRTTITYDHSKKVDLVSVDALVGAKFVQPECAVRFPYLV